MERGGRCATLGLITAFLTIAGPRAEAECGAYEDAERASHRLLHLEDFSGEPPEDDPRARKRDTTSILITTTIRVDALAVQTEPAGDRGWIARPSSVCVRAYFMKGRSWRRWGETADRDLRHEQAHFDLTLVHARRLEVRLAALSLEAGSQAAAERGLRDLATRVHRDELASTQSEQDRYDRETRHGHNRAAQIRWTSEIAARVASEAPPSPAMASR